MLISYREALNLLEKNHLSTFTEVIELNQALGRILKDSVRAPYDLPRWPISAMDGIALKVEDMSEVPCELEVIGTVNAGDEADLLLSDGSCVMINTGGILPSNADTVVKIEDVEIIQKDGRTVAKIKRQVKRYNNVILPGENGKKDDILLEQGQILNPQDLSLLKSLEFHDIEVMGRFQVAILSTGNELVQSPPVPKGKIIESNSIMLSALLRQDSCDVIWQGMVEDDEDSVKDVVVDLLSKVDIVLTVGGTSMGTKDFVPKVLDGLVEREDAVKLFHKVGIAPGKPSGAWKFGNRIVFSLPGYPAACYITYRYLVRPFILGSLGVREKDRIVKGVPAIAGRSIKSKKGRTQFVRVSLLREGDTFVAHPLSTHGASNLATLSLADGIVIVDDGIDGLEVGARVEVDLIRT